MRHALFDLEIIRTSPRAQLHQKSIAALVISQGMDLAFGVTIANRNIIRAESWPTTLPLVSGIESPFCEVGYCCMGLKVASGWGSSRLKAVLPFSARMRDLSRSVQSAFWVN
jgi:hypothetical protein